MPTFIDPFSDTGFKIIFGKEELLKSFLNALFADRPGFEPIKRLTYRPTEQVRNWKEGKSIAYDIHCETETGSQFIVEMQRADQTFFLARSVYYVARAIAQQGYKGRKTRDEIDRILYEDLPEGGSYDDWEKDGEDDEQNYLMEPYPVYGEEHFEPDMVYEPRESDNGPEHWDYNLVPVIGVFFCQFNLPELPKKLITYGALCDSETGAEIGHYFQTVYIQLPVFRKAKRDCQSLFDQWMYNLKHMKNMNTMHFTSHQDVFKRLAKVGNLATLSPRQRFEYDQDLKKARDYHSEMRCAVKKGIARGRNEGLVEGRAEGLAQGRAEGLAEGKAEGLAQGKAEGLKEGEKIARAAIKEDMVQIAKDLLSLGMDLQTISERTKLSIEELRTLI